MKLRAAALLLALVALAGAARADIANEKKVVQGMAFYLGIVPSELVLGAPGGHEERSMHGGTPARPGQYHIMVAVFDTATGERVPRARRSGAAGSRAPRAAARKRQPEIVDAFFCAA